MKPAPFEYKVPGSLSSALDLLNQHGYEAKLLAGGQSLIPAMNFRLVQPSVLVDLNNLNELAYIRESSDGSLQLGPMTRQSQLGVDPLVSSLAPLIAEAVPHIAHEQIRNRGTVGGSLAHADPAAELPVLMTALQAQFTIQSKNGRRSVKAADFYHGLFETDLKPEELLAEIVIPPMSPATGWSFLEFARRRGDYALLGVAIVITLDQNGICQHARIVFLNAGDRPVVAGAASGLLAGVQPSQELFKEVAYSAADEIEPTGDIHASIAYRRHLARVLTEKALNKAYDRATMLRNQ